MSILELLFFLRCIETSFAIIGMNMALNSLHKNARFRIVLSAIIVLITCSFTTILYIHVGVPILEKIFVPIIFLVIGSLVFFNSSDKLCVTLFNFLTQFLFYDGVSMACTMIVRLPIFESNWIYLLMRAVAFYTIILIEVKYIRKPFRYVVQVSDFNWYIYLSLIVAFSVLIILLSIYPTMYYDRPFYSRIEIVVAYIVIALVLYNMYSTLHSIIQKYELLQSEKSMKEKIKYMEKYKRLSEIDPLTDLLNRSSFLEQAEHNLTSGQAAALIMIDIDNFKQINDKFGHSVGDEALKVLSSVLKTSFRSTDLIGRFGGDEFIVLMINEQKDNEFIKQKIEIFNQNLHKVIADNKMIPDFSVSIGVASINDKINFKKIYENADIALYKAKEYGRNRTEFYS